MGRLLLPELRRQTKIQVPPLFDDEANLPQLKDSLRLSEKERVCPAAEVKPPMSTALSDAYPGARVPASDNPPLAGFLDPDNVMVQAPPKATGQWSFARTLALGLTASALLWAAIAATIHYFW
jgi:hypothetical protein